MKIFLSYASEQSELAKEIALALQAENHTVFFDRSFLPPGEPYNAKIREAITNSQLVVFLISPHSVAAGRYTLTELEFAERQWPKPWGHVLPVMVMPTPMADIPLYLRAGTILQPTGNIAATVAAAVNRIPHPAWLGLLQRYRAHLLVLLSLVIVGVGAARWYQQVQIKRATLMRFYSAAKVQQDNRQYEEAWKLLEQVRSLTPDDPETQEKEAKLAMLWLENARITRLENSESGKTTAIGMDSFAAIVDTVLPALSRCSVSSEKIHAANCLAHMGWGEVLKYTSAGAQPQTYYQRALALDPDNPYAHVLWGFHILRTDGSPDEAKKHFERALASGRERPFVRAVQLSAWLNKSGDLGEEEGIRVVNDMRLTGDPLPPDDDTYAVRWSRLDSLYYFRVCSQEKQSFLSALSPSDHLATFQWIFPEAVVPESKQVCHQFVLGRLQELAGDYTGALSTFQNLQNRWAKELGYTFTLQERTTQAINRLIKLQRTGITKK